MARLPVHCYALRNNPDRYFPAPDVIKQICSKIGHKHRCRKLDPGRVLALFLVQVLNGNISITHLRQLSPVGFSPSSYCEARAKLPLEVFTLFLNALAEQAPANHTRLLPLNQSHRRVMVVDGSSFSMPDTPQLLKHFGMPGGQKPEIGYPTGKLMGLLDARTGMFKELVALPLFVHDLAGAISVAAWLNAYDILLGDRAFCSFAHFCLLAQRGVDAVMRLHQQRPRIAGIQTWKKPAKAPVWIDQKLYDSFPQSIQVRVVACTAPPEMGFRTDTIYVATTLMDKDQWPDKAIQNLYIQRWQIETCFNHLKTTMKMDVLKCKTLEGIKKELAVYLLAYNLVRLRMLQEAQKRGIDCHRVSFSDAMRNVAAKATGLLGNDDLIINPERPGRYEPRVRRRRPKEHGLMTMPRHVLKSMGNTRRRA